MSDVLAIIPARLGSKGIPHKNFRRFNLAPGPTPLDLAIRCAQSCGLDVVVTSEVLWVPDLPAGPFQSLLRPPELAQDDTPMIDVVQDVLARVPGPEDQIILLVQPTQPLREPKHLTAAIELLASSGADSVVSVVALPLTHSPEMVFRLTANGRIEPWDTWERGGPTLAFDALPSRRQAAEPGYVRDGTGYAFRRVTVITHGHIYGAHVRPLIIPPEETCALDTEADWLEAERRLREREE